MFRKVSTKAKLRIIRRKIRHLYTAEDIICITLEWLQGDNTIARLGRSEDVNIPYICRSYFAYDNRPRRAASATAPALVFIPLAVLVMGKWKKGAGTYTKSGLSSMSAKQWAWKLVLVAIIYMALYFSAGYYIAWQNPNLVAFYGGVDAGSFWAQMRINMDANPDILQFQFMRGVLWALFALPVIWMYRGRPLEVALLVALLFGVTFNIGHLMPNPLMPDASMRFSHLIETTSSNFVFGLIVVWLLHREHESLRDLFGLKSQNNLRQAETLV
jgi:hypothetical protein